MARSHSTSITRRSAVAGLALTAAPVALARVDRAHAQAKQTMPDKSLYERLGGVFAIAAVVNHFSDAVVKNPIVGQKSKNPQLREWHTKNLGRLPAGSRAGVVGIYQQHTYEEEKRAALEKWGEHIANIGCLVRVPV